MSAFSRVFLAGLACASLVNVQTASAAEGDNANGDTRGRFFHAGKCVMSLGFGGGCDKDAPAPKGGERIEAKADTSTRGQFFHASKCVVSLGFVGGCDKDEVGGSASGSARKADAAPDASTKGQFFHATKCVTTLGFGGGCDKK